MLKKNKQKNYLRKWIKSLLGAFFILIIIRTFFFQFYVVTHNKMENSLRPGDYLLVNKIDFGPRLPITFFALPINENFIPFLNIKSYFSIFELPYLRIKTGKIERNDILVFNYPNMSDISIDLKPQEISRCIALPGDTLEIKDKEVIINHKHTNSTYPLFHYRITTDGTYFSQHFMDSIGVKGKLISDIGIYKFYISPATAQTLKKLKYIRYVQKISDFWHYNSILCFPENSKTIGWNKDYFGPIVIPKKGQTVKLTLKNIDIYRKIIENYEKNTLKIDTSGYIYINNRLTSFYTFKQNYYFVMDDNRDMAKDSRYWGFLPESHIIGKASIIWLSINKDIHSIRLNRIFKTCR
ncbi:MAG TPA: signal peptidase I [Bacteroidales bacterium]|nr:signal peptidase I [Bacteroidales bacterium]